MTANNSIIGRLCDLPECGAGAITLAGAGNQLGVDPLLGPLAANGGPTQTRVPQLGSPAIDKGNNALGLANDQRGTGFPRTIGAADRCRRDRVRLPGAVRGLRRRRRQQRVLPERGVDEGSHRDDRVRRGGNYCPDSDVIRLAMAAFMKRFGLPLSGLAFIKAQASGLARFRGGARHLPVRSRFRHRRRRAARCSTPSSRGWPGRTASAARRSCTARTAATTWVPSPQLFTIRATFKADQWRSVHLTGHYNVEANKALRFGLRMDRPDASSSGVTDSTCRLRVRMENSAGFTPL